MQPMIKLVKASVVKASVVETKRLKRAHVAVRKKLREVVAATRSLKKSRVAARKKLRASVVVIRKQKNASAAKVSAGVLNKLIRILLETERSTRSVL